MINSRYNFLTVLRQSEDSKKYICRCDCGSETIVSAYRLRKGTTKSCGCLQRKKASTLSGMCVKFHKEYQTWMRMKLRCSPTAEKATKEKYFNRGITVCADWLNSFEKFFEDMGMKPEGQELDRINNDLGYYLENCRWTTESLNAFNRRQRNSKSGMTGIFKKPSGSYDVTIGKKQIGTFKDLHSAVRARADAELSTYGTLKKETKELLINLNMATE